MTPHFTTAPQKSRTLHGFSRNALPPKFLCPVRLPERLADTIKSAVHLRRSFAETLQSRCRPEASIFRTQL